MSPPEFWFNEEEADLACLFFEKYLVHVKGEWAGQPLILPDWAIKDIIRPVFGCMRWDPEHGGYLRQYRTVYAEIPRKNAKSTICAGIGLKLLCADKEPGAEIYSAAADKKQAAIVFDMARQMVKQSPKLSGMITPFRDNLTYQKNGSFYRVLSADAFTKDGLNAHGIIFDELHTQKSRDLWDVLTTSVGSRRQPLIVAITTAGTNRNSICWEQHEYARKVKEGVIDDPTFLPVLYAADATDDWTSPDTWKKANPGLGISVKLTYIRNKCEEAIKEPAKENTFRRLHLNQWTSQESRWMPMREWDMNGSLFTEENLLPIDGEKRVCFGGLDLAKTTDLTALSYVFPESENRYKVLMRFWLPEDGISLEERGRRDGVGDNYAEWYRRGWLKLTPGVCIDKDVVLRQIEKDAEIYDIREIAFDRYGSDSIVHKLDQQEIKVIPFAQGPLSMNAACNELLALVLAGKLDHGKNPILRWNADNVVVESDSNGNIKPSKKKSTQKIDGIVALVMALDRAIRDRDEGGSVYDERGLITW